MKMNCVIHSACATMLALVSLLRADDDPAAQLRALDQEYRAAQEGFSTRYRAARTADEREQLMSNYRRPTTYVVRCLELAGKYPKSPAALDALSWVVQHQPYGSEFEKAAVMLLDHIQDEKIGDVFPWVAGAASDAPEMLLRSAIVKNPSRNVQGRACFYLGEFFRNQLDEKQAGQFYERVLKDYADVPARRGGTIAEAAKAALFEMRELTIGKVAPEIVGEDIDGKPMKLSEFRGKVVVLDFWGFW